MPGDPAFGNVEPARPLPLEEVWGPRKPGPQPKPSSSSASAPAEQAAVGPVQRCKAPPPYKEVQSAPAGPPPAASATVPGGPGSYCEVAKGATSKTAPTAKVAKKPPPELPADAVKPEPVQAAAASQAELPARIPAAEA
eukprot:2079149-Amphidinium_carterae.1